MHLESVPNNAHLKFEFSIFRLGCEHALALLCVQVFVYILQYEFPSTSWHGQVPGVTDRGLVPRHVKKVAILGGGLMGSGIATALVLSNYSVILKEVNEKFLDAGINRIKGENQFLGWLACHYSHFTFDSGISDAVLM